MHIPETITCSGNNRPFDNFPKGDFLKFKHLFHINDASTLSPTFHNIIYSIFYQTVPSIQGWLDIKGTGPSCVKAFILKNLKNILRIQHRQYSYFAKLFWK